MKILVNNFVVGEYSVFLGDWDIKLEQIIEAGNDDIIKIAYYNPDWATYFAIYAYIWENLDTKFYLIDSRKISTSDADEYHAVEISDEGDISKVVIKLIQEKW